MHSEWSRTIYARGADEDYLIMTRGGLVAALGDGMRMLGGGGGGGQHRTLCCRRLDTHIDSTPLYTLAPAPPCAPAATSHGIVCLHAPAPPPHTHPPHPPTHPPAGRLLDRIRVVLAGRAAEEVALGAPSTYGTSDLRVRPGVQGTRVW